MGFFGVTDEFYLLTEATPSYPFRQLPDIVSRAKFLLKNRSKTEIISAANIIDWVLEEHFNQCKYECVQDILTNEESSNNWVLRYLSYEERDEMGITNLLDEWPTETGNPCPYFSSASNTSELTALTECIKGYSLDDDVDFPNGCEFEYFAALALRLVGKTIMELPSKRRDNFSKLSTAQQNMIEFKVSLDKFTESISPGVAVAMAGEHALDAMGAVYYAEHLRTIEEQNEKLMELQIELHQTSQNIDTIAEEKLKKKISLAASNAAIKRHAKSAKLKNRAVELYLTKTWPSVRQASKNIFPQLVELGDEIDFVFSPERGEQTVYEWLLAANKEIRKQADV